MATLYCETCGIQFEAERSSAKYCKERCKQRAKRNRKAGLPDSQMLKDFWDTAKQLTLLKDKYIKPSKSPNMQVQIQGALDSIRHTIDHIQADLSVIEIEQQNTWYQCLNCGQGSFGRVEICDFCKESKFKVISV